MGKHYKILLTILITFGLFLAAGLVFGGSLKLKKEIPIKTNLSYDVKAEIPLKDEKVDFISPDGKAILTVKRGREVNGIITQTFYISTEKDENPVKFFEKESSPESLISVPDNTFSPDNKYIFLKYDELGTIRYIVLRTDGEDIKKDGKTVEIVGLFNEKYQDFVITDVTGWGSYSLIVVNTDTLDGKTGPSWWFDLSNFSFIRLSSRFN